jgi:hypothetical protein
VRRTTSSSLVLCFKTPIPKRKWLWMVFVAVGIGQLSFNWNNGGYQIQAFYFALLGAGFQRAGPFAPYIFNAAIPVGAIVFLFRRKSWLDRAALARPGSGSAG